jgi:CheY-like chemotaxis protein
MPTLLYVDDEADNLFAFKAVFRRSYRIEVAESGAEALQKLAEQPFDLIITDQRMPQMTGVELLEQVYQTYPETIRMVLTGYSDMQAIVEAINKGHIYHYVTKPWQAEELKLVIDRALEAATLRKRNAELEKAQIMAQFEILKNQINPHFLFNSMNSLHALIAQDAQAAQRFTKHFARLYRSVLSLREQMVIDLKEELAFVQDYLALQQIRFPLGLQVTQQIPEAALSMGIPPFALQTVLENVIKHNVISSAEPISVEMNLEGNTLLVRNLLRPKNQVEDSTETGLKNLQERYRLIGGALPTFGPKDGYYLSQLPLIPSE